MGRTLRDVLSTFEANWSQLQEWDPRGTMRRQNHEQCKIDSRWNEQEEIVGTGIHKFMKVPKVNSQKSIKK